MVSIAIMGIIAVATMGDLRTSQRKDQLNNAVRVIAADLRTVQAKALTGQNVKSCPKGTSIVVCEQDSALCSDPASCIAQPPSAIGLHFASSSVEYTEFADVAKADWLQSLPNELVQMRSLPILGAEHVQVYGLISGGAPVQEADVSFKRQTGAMGIDGCYGDCPGPHTLTIRLQQTQTGETKDVVLNAITGRISIE